MTNWVLSRGQYTSEWVNYAREYKVAIDDLGRNIIYSKCASRRPRLYEPVCEDDFIWCYCTNNAETRTADGKVAYKQVANKTRIAGGEEKLPYEGVGHTRVDNSEFSTARYTSPNYKDCDAYAKSEDAKSKGIT